MVRCSNSQPHLICNRFIPTGTSNQSGGLCDLCQLTTVIPDLKIEGNVEKWRRLESAKQRVLYMLDVIGLPFREDVNSPAKAVRFEFKSDGIEPVATGHSDSCIVINIKEADSVSREIARVRLGEPQRTLVGHFRHELGHYFWDRLVKTNEQKLQEFRLVFGDERDLNYSKALSSYYKDGPTDNWTADFVSAYATMHPWEDFAEIFATYLDMLSVLDTAENFGMGLGGDDNFESMLQRYTTVGIIVNEMNRDMGLLDLVPEVFTKSITKKLFYIHRLV